MNFHEQLSTKIYLDEASAINPQKLGLRKIDKKRLILYFRGEILNVFPEIFSCLKNWQNFRKILSEMVQINKDFINVLQNYSL